jgi:hypothetical protein
MPDDRKPTAAEYRAWAARHREMAEASAGRTARMLHLAKAAEFERAASDLEDQQCNRD